MNDLRWNMDILGKVKNSLSMAQSELEILIKDLKETKDIFIKQKDKLERIKSLVSADSQIGQILREP